MKVYRLTDLVFEHPIRIITEARASENLVLAGEPGFVQEHESYWDVHNPFKDW